MIQTTDTHQTYDSYRKCIWENAYKTLHEIECIFREIPFHK